MTDIATLFQNAIKHVTAGQWPEAEPYFRQIIAKDPRHFDALQLLGIACVKTNRADEGIALLKQALTINPNHPAVWNNLGETQRQQGNLVDAAASLERAIRLAPQFAEPYYNLAIVTRAQGNDEKAAEIYRHSLQLQPQHAKARFNLANLLREQGRTPAALNEYETVISQSPNWFEARLNLGNCRLDMGQTEEAIEDFKLALVLKPSELDVAENIADAYAKLGNLAEATKWFDRSLAPRPARWLRALRRDTLLEVIPSSLAAIDEGRQRLQDRLEKALADPPSLNLEDLHTSAVEPPMLLAYHGRNDRPLYELYGQFFGQLIPDREVAKPTGKPRVGIVVTHGHEGVFGRCLAPLIDRLDKSKIDLTIICSLAGKNILSHLFFKTPHDYLVLPARIDDAAQALSARQFHLLHYWEVGTDSTNYFLPYFRPAWKQATTWGWPVTTGNARVDYFVSAQGLEPAGAQDHYTETLVELSHIPTYYERPPVPSLLPSRADVGLPENTRVYFSPQNLRKYHPDFDAAIADILRRDPAGHFCFIADEIPAITKQLLARFEKSIPDVLGRIVPLPRLPREQYLAALALADVNLDTFHYGGGANTVYDSIAAGTPMVTLTGSFHRGRYASQTFATMQLAGMTAATPDQYADLAVTIAKDKDRRAHLSQEMKQRAEIVLESRPAIAPLEEFFLEVTAQD